MQQPPSRVQGTRREVIEAFARSDLGRTTIRRELVEGAQIQPGQEALVLAETDPVGGVAAVVDLVVATLRDLGARVVVLRVDELIPVRPGTTPGAWSYVEKYQPPSTVHAAIRAADVVLDYTLNSRGAQKYNEAFYTLSTFYGKRIFAHRAVEAPEVLGDDPSAPIAMPDALTFPSDLLRFVADRVNDALIAAARAREPFRLTNPWGTDVRFTVLPGDVCIVGGGIRRYPDSSPFEFAGDDNRRLWNALAGCTVTQTCDGVWVTKHCSLLGGSLSAPMTVTVKDGFLADASGGPEARRLLEIVAEEPAGIHAILMGLNPKASPFRGGRYMLDNNGAGVGVSHMAFGGPGLFYRKGEWGALGDKHFQLGDIPKISFWAGSRCLVEDGRLLTLQEPDVRDFAREYGDPDVLLRQFDWPADEEI